MPDPHLGDVSGAIKLRRWAWALLSGRPQPVPEASSGAWRLFLDREACAAALARAPAPDIPDGVRARAARESQRILLARAELAAVAGAVAKAGLAVIPLKGTDALRTPDAALTLKDVDVLARPNDAAATERALEAGGFAAASFRSYLHVVLTRPGTDLPVELHGTIWPQAARSADELWRAASPAAAVPGLWTLAPADHLWLSLVHVVAVHPERSGRLRDLLLIREAAAQCGADDRTEVAHRIGADPLHQELADELALACGNATPAVALHADRLAASWYALDAMMARLPVGRAVRLRVATWASLLAAPRTRPGVVIGRLLAAGGTSRLRPVAWVETKNVWIGRALRVGIRMTWAVPIICLALPYAARARAAARAVEPA